MLVEEEERKNKTEPMTENKEQKIIFINHIR